MIKTLLICFALTLWLAGKAQESSPAWQPHITVKWAPTGLLLGSTSLQAEYNFGGRNSLTAKVGIPVNVKHNLTYEEKKVGFNMKATSFLAGYRTYLSKKHLRGFYYEPFFHYVYHTSEGTGNGTLDSREVQFHFMNNYSGTGVGIQFGSQFLVGKRFVIDLFFLGPVISSASNTLKATDISQTAPWTYMDTRAAEHDVRTFVNQFPFIRNRTKVMADKDAQRVTAHFKGVLPGIRAGVSVGLAF